MNILSHLAFPSWLQRIFCCPLEHWPMQEKHSLLLMRSELTTCRLCKLFNGYLTDSAWIFSFKKQYVQAYERALQTPYLGLRWWIFYWFLVVDQSHHFYHGVSSCSSFSPCLEFLVSLEQLKWCSEYTYYIYRLLHSRQFLLPTDSPKSS